MSQLSSSGFALGRRTGLCAASGEPIPAGAEVVTVLLEPEESDPAMVRLDYTASAWDAGARPPAERVVFAYWRSLQPEGGHNARKRLVSDEEMIELFSRSEDEQDDPRRVTFRYVLSLLLIRRRLLSVVGNERRDGADVLKVRVRGRPEEVLEVRDPGLSDAALETEMETLVEMLMPAGDEEEDRS